MVGALFPQVDFDGSTGGAVLGDVEGGAAVVGRGAEAGAGELMERPAREGSSGVESWAEVADVSAGVGVAPAAGGLPAGG